jgi:hypothetical protein
VELEGDLLMFQSIFGNVDFGDMKAMSDWAGFHANSHSQLVRAGGNIGYFVPDQLLSSADDITDDWFGRHALQHLALERVSATISGGGQNTSMPTAGIFTSLED